MIKLHAAGNLKSHPEHDGRTTNEDTHEMAAFMKMFVDLVDMFNDDKQNRKFFESRLPKG